MRVVEIATSDALAPLVPAWTALVERSPGGAFFETPEWLISWLEAFWEPRPAAFLFVWEADDLVGFAPFLRDENGDAWCPHTLTLPNHAHLPRTTVVAAPGRQAAVLDAVLEHFAATRRSPRVILANVDGESTLWPDIEHTIERRGLTSMRWPGPQEPWVRVDGTWEAYLQTRSPHVRSEMRRKRRKLERSGQMEITVLAGPGADVAAMERVMEVERQSWKHETSTSFDTEPGVEQFYSRLAERAANRGWLRVYLLGFDNAPAAHVYGMVYKNEYLALKTSYIQAQRALSPGTVLFEHALRDAFEQQYRSFDLLGVEARWKNELATSSRQPVTACLFAPSAVRCRACRSYNCTLKPILKEYLAPLRRRQ
jgi:CelD/BcsL family acetyltransferase involved in cellulose biosynthesis